MVDGGWVEPRAALPEPQAVGGHVGVQLRRTAEMRQTVGVCHRRRHRTIGAAQWLARPFMMEWRSGIPRQGNHNHAAHTTSDV